MSHTDVLPACSAGADAAGLSLKTRCHVGLGSCVEMGIQAKGPGRVNNGSHVPGAVTVCAEPLGLDRGQGELVQARGLPAAVSVAILLFTTACLGAMQHSVWRMHGAEGPTLLAHCNKRPITPTTNA